MAKILIVDDDIMLCNALSQAVEGMGYETAMAHSLAQGIAQVLNEEFDVVILDVRLPDGNGQEAVPRFREGIGSPEVIILTGIGDPDGAELAIRSGAWDYITKPPSLNKIRLPVQRAVEFHRRHVPQLPILSLKRSGIVGESQAIKACLEQVSLAAVSDSNVLISGATGTGKELFARAVHHNSLRASGPFVVVDCAALPGNLIESMLFGHEKGAFTGAENRYAGLVRRAHGGTLFLDEVGELNPPAQKIFLRVLQEHTFLPVGGTREESSDFRLVAATNRDLDQMVKAGEFRQDLLYRLRTITIPLPTLIERGGDIELLCRHFVGRYCNKAGIALKRLSSEFLEALELYHWPGNVRELIHSLESSLAVAGEDPILFQCHLPTNIRVNLARSSLTDRKVSKPSQRTPQTEDTFPRFKDYRAEKLAEVEFRYLQDVMAMSRGNVGQACILAGLSKARLYALLKAHGLTLAKGADRMKSSWQQ